MYRTMFILLIFFSLINMDITHAKINSMGDAINKAGRQRMLTQRMVRNYALIALNIQAKDYQKGLHQAASLFNTQLSELRDYSPTDQTDDALAKVVQLWTNIQPIVKGSVTLQQVEMLRSEAEKLLAASHKVVLVLEDIANSSSGKLVNLAGRQRMLSQRMANLYMLMALGFTKAHYQSDLRQAMMEFKEALSVLRSAKENTKEISQALIKVRTQFDIFKHSLETKSGKFLPNIVARASESILVKMNEITKMYADLLK